MELRLHRHGRFRRWLGSRLGGDDRLGDRAWRRIVHAFGAAVLVYYLLPVNFFVLLSNEEVLLLALAAVLAIEGLRHAAGLELPTLREYERTRVGSYVFYSIALVGAIVFFPPGIACAVVLGTAWVDPLAGELRGSLAHRRLYPAVPLAVYFTLAIVSLALVARWPLLPSAGLAALAAGLGVAAERPKYAWIDDDLTMTFIPAVALYLIGVVGWGLGA